MTGIQQRILCRKWHAEFVNLYIWPKWTKWTAGQNQQLEPFSECLNFFAKNEQYGNHDICL